MTPTSPRCLEAHPDRRERWIDEGTDVDRPAPILKLANAAAGAETGDNGAESGLALALGAAGLIAGVAALVVAVLAYRRRPAQTPT